ncbi:hypothetical protein [uncultured Nostoc sp.]
MKKLSTPLFLVSSLQSPVPSPQSLRVIQESNRIAIDAIALWANHK